MNNSRATGRETHRHALRALSITVVLATGFLPRPAPGDAAHDAPPMAVPIDGPTFPARLVAVDADWNITFAVGDEVRRVAAEDLVAWGVPREPKRRDRLPGYFPPAELLLADGGILAVDVRASEGDTLLAESDAFGEIKVPIQWLDGLLFAAPIDRGQRDQRVRRLLDPSVNSTLETDQVWLANGDKIGGRVVRFVAEKELPPAAGETKPRKQPAAVELMRVAAKRGTAPIAFDAPSVTAIRFNPRLVMRPKDTGSCAVVGFRDGSRLLVRRLELSETAAVCHLPSGARWTASPEEIVFLQPFGSRLTYVSDRVVPTSLDDGGDASGTNVGLPAKPEASPTGSARYKHVPFLTVTWPYRSDRAVDGTHLRSGGRLYLKGLGMHSFSVLTLALPPGEYDRFDAQIALDASVGQAGNVTFAVIVHGPSGKGEPSKVLRQYRSPAVRGGDAPRAVSIRLAGADRLTLAVLYGERGDVADHANWLDARLVRK